MRMLVVGSVAAVLAATMPMGTALAQSDTVVLSGSDLGVMTTSQTQERVAQLEASYQRVNLAGPRAGVGVSAILVPGGAFMLGAGIGIARWQRTFFCPPEMPRCGDPDPGWTAMAITGGLALAGGLVGAVIASRKLRQRKKERRRIEREINTLKRALPPESH